MNDDYDIENEIASLLGSLAEAAHLDDATPETYEPSIRLLIHQFGVSNVVYKFLEIRFRALGMGEDEAESAAHGFLMGLQMAMRHSEWARTVVNDIHEDPDISSIVNSAQDSLARMLPLE